MLSKKKKVGRERVNDLDFPAEKYTLNQPMLFFAGLFYPPD